MIKQWYSKIVNKPKGATMSGWADWTEATKKNHPILYALFDRLPAQVARNKRRIKDFFYHTRQKYGGNGFHVLKLDVVRFKEPYGRKALKKYGWMDSDYQLGLFPFQILVNFVENEVGLSDFIEIAYDDDPNSSSDRYKQLLELYYWFIDDYCESSYARKLKEELKAQFPDHKTLKRRDIFAKPRNQREREYQQATSIMYGKITDHEEALEEQMTENLIKLIKLRGCMWT